MVMKGEESRKRKKKTARELAEGEKRALRRGL